MSETRALRGRLAELAAVLEESGEDTMASAANRAVRGSDAELVSFLISNDLWGGAGSVGDQAGVRGTRDRTGRQIEKVLVQLGEEQLRANVANPRTAMWVDVFQGWAKNGT